MVRWISDCGCDVRFQISETAGGGSGAELVTQKRMLDTNAQSLQNMTPSGGVCWNARYQILANQSRYDHEIHGPLQSTYFKLTRITFLVK